MSFRPQWASQFGTDEGYFQLLRGPFGQAHVAPPHCPYPLIQCTVIFPSNSLAFKCTGVLPIPITRSSSFPMAIGPYRGKASPSPS
jgi:hypothetical protein